MDSNTAETLITNMDKLEIKMEKVAEKAASQDTKIAVIVSLAENLKIGMGDVVNEIRGLRNEIQNSYTTTKEHTALRAEVKAVQDNNLWLGRTLAGTVLGLVATAVSAYLFRV